ncbi:MAG TPA: amidohydrolase family protein, partial [Pyrinomonadaceae bacterium]|nr:amidohydrolase family protein [Pyrinomonadaceae bacterium]
MFSLNPAPAFAQTQQSFQSKPIVFTRVTVIDMTGAPAKPDMTVVVSGSRIAALGKTGKVRVPAEAQTIDATGKFLIPGLWDMHAHLSYYGEAALPLLVANGVTGVRDMGGDLNQIDDWRRRISAGTLAGPHIVRCGSFVDGPKKMDAFRASITDVVTSEAQARGIVRSLKQRGVDFIKTHSRISRDAYFALADEARKQKLPFAGHLPPGVTAAEASDAGVRSIEHIESLMEDVMYLDRAERDKRIQGALDELAGAKGATLYKRFVKNRTWVVPTILTKLKIGGAVFQRKFNPVINALNQAGVGLLAGTDFTFKSNGMRPGFDLHEELVLLVEAGLTPMHALQTATVNPAKSLDMAKTRGTIEKGKAADLILLEANPLENIKNTQRITAVLVNGRHLSKEMLRNMLADTDGNSR